MVLRSLQLSLMRADHRARKMGIGRAVAFQRRDAVQHEVGNADAFPRDQVHTASLGKIAFRALRVLRQDGVPHRLGEQVTVGEPAGRAPVQLFHWLWGDGIKAGTKEMPQGLGEMEILAKAVAQQHARLMVEPVDQPGRSEEHTSELQSLMRISYAVFCLKKRTCRYILSCNS